MLNVMLIRECRGMMKISQERLHISLTSDKIKKYQKQNTQDIVNSFLQNTSSKALLPISSKIAVITIVQIDKIFNN